MPTGFGGGGLASVSTNTTLTGTGTSGSPLSVAGWPVTFFTNQSNQGNPTALTGANNVNISGFVLTASLTFGHISVTVTATDAVNNYDFGIYNTAGALQTHTGAIHLPSAGKQTFVLSGGSITLAAGLYAFAWTGNAVTATVDQDTGPAFIWIQNNNVATSAGGVLPASIGALSVSVTGFPLGFALS